MSGFHNKYRPMSLKDCIGNEAAVKSLSKFIDKEAFPSAILLTGPPSAGKTTLARAFAADALGVERAENSPNFEDVNFSESRTIDDIRALISQARLRPLNGRRRFILCDEAHGILSSPAAANAFLKPLEEPVPTTTWILSSMEPDKFSGTTLGKAIASRCVPLRLKAPTEEDLFAQAVVIARAEKIAKLVGKERLKELVENSDKTYRGISAQLEIFSSLKEDPEEAFQAAMNCGVSYQESPDDELISEFVVATLKGEFAQAQMLLTRIKDGVQLLMKLGYYSWFLLSTKAAKGQRTSVWGTTPMWAAWKQLSSLPIDRFGLFHSKVVNVRIQSGAFAVSGQQAASVLAFELSKS